MGSTIVYEDEWGEIIDRRDGGVIEIRWFDTTSEMDPGRFNAWLATFAGAVEHSGHSRVLVDSTVFGMPMEQMDWEYRNTQVIPRYNAAGVTRFGFIMPAGMPLIGTDPAVDGPADFPTAYFGARTDAMAWLTD